MPRPHCHAGHPQVATVMTVEMVVTVTVVTTCLALTVTLDPHRLEEVVRQGQEAGWWRPSSCSMSSRALGADLEGMMDEQCSAVSPSWPPCPVTRWRPSPPPPSRKCQAPRSPGRGQCPYMGGVGWGWVGCNCDLCAFDCFESCLLGDRIPHVPTHVSNKMLHPPWNRSGG